MTELDKLRRERGAHRGAVTKYLNDINSKLTSSGDIDDELEAKIELLSKKLGVLQSYDEKVLALTDNDTDLSREVEESDEITLKVISLQNKAKRENNGLSETRSDRTLKAKLPKINLKPFAGDGVVVPRVHRRF